MICQIQILIVLSIAFLIKSELTLEEYAEYETENPQNLFELRSQNDQNQYHPNIKKLIFLTPWNKIGNQFSIKYANKIAYVSPCWYELIAPKNEIIFENQGLYDQEFIKAIKAANPNIKILPRVYVSGSSIKVLQGIGTNKNTFKKTVTLIAKLIKEKQFDGIVWDSPYNFFETSRKAVNQLLSQFIEAIRNEIGAGKLIFFNMASPLNHMNTLEIDLYHSLKINAILIQSYDTGKPHIQVIEKNIEWARKLSRKDIDIILLLPFFSSKSGVGSINTADAIKSLQKYGTAHSEMKDGICQFTQNKTKKVYQIPCYYYFKKAFELIEKAGFSVGFWEGGNGIENYYQFF